MDNNSFNNKLISKRYRIIKKIASGGMADIFLGDDLELGRKVAIKILAPNYAGDKNFVARFKSEAQILARLSHPNIVQVYDWGEYNGTYFICIEYIEGDSLKEIIEKKGPLAPETAIGYALQISSALYAAHKNNLIHRDIKPQNILITPEGKVKVADFGIAKSIITDVTRTLNIMGTAHYISPEQAKGEVLDHRTDIYSLGIVIYEMLTADVPFRGGSSIDISLKHIYEKPLKPSELIENIPEKLEKIIMHCLEKEPAARYSDLVKLISDLQNYKTDKPLSFNIKSPVTGRKNVFKQKMKSPIPGIIAGALALIFLVLSVIYISKYYSAENPASSMVTVPPVENIPVDNAGRILSLFGLRLEITDESFHSEIPEGCIIEQNPESGENIPKESEIEVTVSKGIEITAIPAPNLIGTSLEEAQKLLQDCGLKRGNIVREYSEDFEENIVIKQTPRFNEPIKPGTAVNLTVSRGKEFILIPNIIGEDFIEASNYLLSLGLIIESSKSPVKEGDAINEPGKIVKAVPAPGSRVEAGSVVRLFISTNQPLVMAPDLIHSSLEEAISMLESLNLSYEISYIGTDYSIQINTVLGQVPESGTYISPDSGIVLFIGR